MSVGWLLPLVVLPVVVLLLLRGPAFPARTPGGLVAVARQWNLDLQALGAAGWDGPLFLRLELRPAWRRFRRVFFAEVRVRASGMPAGLAVRPRVPSDGGRGLVVDHGRFDEVVRIDADDPADALSRLGAGARAAVQRAVLANACAEAGEWRVEAETDGSDLDPLLRTLVAAARAMAKSDGDVGARLSTLARTDPILEVRCRAAAERVARGGLLRWDGPRLARVLREGVAATPPVPGAAQALGDLQALRAETEAGHVSLADEADGALSVAPLAGGEVAMEED